MVTPHSSIKRRSVCCIPSLDSKTVESTTCTDEDGFVDKIDAKFDCRRLGAANRNCNDHNSSNSSTIVAIRSGPHGLHAVATRDIKAGTVVVRCLPLAHSILVPPGTSPMMDDDDEDNDGEQRRRCARCFFREGDEDSSGSRNKKFGRCSKCRVARYCSRSCQADDWNEQHKLECRYYAKRRKRSSRRTELCARSPEEDALPLLLRTFNSLKFMRDNPKGEDGGLTEEGVDSVDGKVDGDFEAVDDAIVSCGPRHFASMAVSPEHVHATIDAVASFGSPAMCIAKDLMLSHAARGSNKANGNADADAVLRIWGYENDDRSDGDRALSGHDAIDRAMRRALDAFRRNNFGIVDSLHSPIGEGVYPCAALLNHSCDPNCVLRYELGAVVVDDDDAGGGGGRRRRYRPPMLRIVACRDVARGEELCHSYVDLALGTEERQARLMETHGFACECPRCEGERSIELPKRREEWALWPLRSEFRAMEGKGLAPKSSLTKVDLDGAMNECRGMSATRRPHILRQSEAMLEEANRCMADGDTSGELRHLRKATELYSTGGDGSGGAEEWMSPFHVRLYSVRCSYLSALLANGKIQEAAEQCEHVVSFLAVAFSHVRHHPLLGLQLYTLGDLYAAAATMKGGEDPSFEEKRYSAMSLLAYAWAKRVMVVTHGAGDPMVRTLKDNIANAFVE